MAKRLTTESRDKLKKLIPMLASDQNGEVIAAVGAIRRTLQHDGHDLHDLAAKLSKQQRETITLAVVPDITINGKEATADRVKKLILAFNKLQKDYEGLEEKIDNLQVEYDELEEQNELLQANYDALEVASKVTKSLGRKVVEGVVERLGYVSFVLVLMWYWAH